MIFDKVNIADALRKEKNKLPHLIEEVKKLLSQSSRQDEDVLKRLTTSEIEQIENISLSKEDSENLFSLKEIETICVNYRLRFLDSKHFKAAFPYEAISKVNDFEKKYNVKINKFKVIAPDKAFDLKDCNEDPLLFAQVNNNSFYLIHKWGNDLAWHRKYVYFPIRSVYTYFYCIILLATILSFSIPFDWLQVTSDNAINIRMWFAIHCTIGLFFFILFIGAITQTNFSSMMWRSKYWNE